MSTGMSRNADTPNLKQFPLIPLFSIIISSRLAKSASHQYSVSKQSYKIHILQSITKQTFQ